MALTDLTEAGVTALQRKLQELGFYDGKIDGRVGPLTRASLKRFYDEQARLASQGQVSPSGMQVLGLDADQYTRPSSMAEPDLER